MSVKTNIIVASLAWVGVASFILVDITARQARNAVQQEKTEKSLWFLSNPSVSSGDRRSIRVIIRLLVIPIRLLHRLSRWLLWNWNGSATILSLAVSLAGFVFVLSDLAFEAGATISSPASDPIDPFLFPFTITNNSHIFTLKNVKWFVRLDDVASQTNWSLGSIIIPESDTPAPTIPPGEVFNIDVRLVRKRVPNKIIRARIYIEASYESVFPYVGSIFSRTTSTQFTWISDANPPQWIRGAYSTLPEFSPKEPPPNGVRNIDIAGYYYQQVTNLPPESLPPRSELRRGCPGPWLEC